MNKTNNTRIHIDGRMIYMSGIGRCLREIIKEITCMGKNIKIYLYGKEPDYKRYLEEYSIDDSLVSFRKNNSPIYSPREQVIGSWLNLKNKSNDVFYYPHYNLPYLVHKNSIVTIHDFIQFKFPEYFGENKVRIARFILNNSVKKAKRIVVDSNSTRKDFYGYFPKYKREVEVIYNGISKKFRNLEDGKKKVFLRANKLNRYILFIGNDKPHKNISGLIDSFLNVKKEYSDLKLVIISKGFDLDKLYIDNSLKEDIIIINSVSEEELILYYNCACMLVLPSFYEGFGLPVIEAMACGCPVIASNVSSMPELGSDAALYIDPYDKNSIAAVIVKLIKDKRLRDELIWKGYERARLFTWASTAKKYLEVFRGII